jgi:hypothetical protein
MSRAIVDLHTYRRLLRAEFYRLRNQGDPDITSAFRCEEDAAQSDFQKDYDEARQEDWTK